MDNSRIKLDLIEFIKYAKTPFHCVQEAETLLKEHDFQRLPLKGNWRVTKGGRYYISPFPTCIFAFAVGEKEERGVHIAAAHTDYPCLHLKPKAELMSGGYLKLNVEVYGGPILNSWFDRPLSIAGRVMLKSDNIYAPEIRLVDFEKPVLTIPNQAIHYNRDVNKGVELKKQTDMLPLFGLFETVRGLCPETGEAELKENFFNTLLAKRLGCKPEEILDFDLYAYNTEEPCFIGEAEEFISSPRLDNQTSCYALIDAIINGKNEKGINVIALFDNEEIGSGSKQGADSTLLPRLLKKLYASLGKTESQYNDDLMDGFLLSADVAHAVHPAHEEKFDQKNRSGMNDGVVLKLSVNQRYSYDNEAVAIMQQLLEKNNIKYSKFVNHSDMPGGGTLGPIISAIAPMKTVDIGVPILAMHSCRELMGAEDEAALTGMVTAFFD